MSRLPTLIFLSVSDLSHLGVFQSTNVWPFSVGEIGKQLGEQWRGLSAEEKKVGRGYEILIGISI
jgi:hypothetical protein